MKKKKVLGMLLAASMTAAMLAGCGSTTDNKVTNNEEKTETKNDVASDTTPDEAQDETLTVWCWDPNFNVYAMKQAEKIYQQDHPNFKLDIQEKVYSDIE